MSSLAALALATPVFGLALVPPAYAAPDLAPEVSLQLAQASETTQRAAEEAIDPALREQLATRRTMADWMTGLGIAAFGGMVITNVLGAIHFHDQYGFSSAWEGTPCARGSAVMQEYCEGTVVPHAIAASTAATLYIGSSLLGWFMPDPLHARDQPGPYGDRIRLHRTLRWVTSALVIGQALLGMFISNADWFGLDQRQDFQVLQGFAIAHLTLGMASLASLAIQGSVMLF